MQPKTAGTRGGGRQKKGFSLPELASAALRQTPCLRVPSLLPIPVAEDLHDELLHGMEYERVELGDATRQWRAERPLGDVYFGAMRRKPGWRTPAAVEAVLVWFESDEFVSWLSDLAGERLGFLRPMTAYRMDTADRLGLHDDMSDPAHAVSVVYNLSAGWQPDWGGATVYGEVTGVTALATPAESPIELQRWRIGNERLFVPEFNSLLVMRLDRRYAHGVNEITGDRPRLALVGIYGREVP
ncbi:MAG: 2OG-Fe(II) oxygenase [Actinobacteria bacterium]|nr:2OG-Fe(II) oxygenase [Actinomycetota bacterium]